MKILTIILLKKKKKHFKFLKLNTNRDNALFHIMKINTNSSPQKDREIKMLFFENVALISNKKKSMDF